MLIEKSAQSLMAAIMEPNTGTGGTFDIIEQDENQSLDAFTLEALVKIAGANAKNFDVKNLQKTLVTSISNDKLQLKHVELLQKEGILAAMPDNVDDIRWTHYALGLRNPDIDLMHLEAAPYFDNDYDVKMHVLGEFKE